MKSLFRIFGKPVRLAAAVFVGAILLMGAGDDSARYEKLGHQMMCMCGCNYILLECNHVNCPYSGPMTKELSAAISDGKPDKEVLASFVDKYGTTVLAAPSKTGFDRVAWIMPYLALVLGIGGVVVVAYTWHNRRTVARSSSMGARPSAALDSFREQARKETEL